jgi:hypothetical protein
MELNIPFFTDLCYLEDFVLWEDDPIQSVLERNEFGLRKVCIWIDYDFTSYLFSRQIKALVEEMG